MYLRHQLQVFHLHNYNEKLTGIGEFFIEVKLLNFSCIDKYSHCLYAGKNQYKEERIINCWMFIEKTRYEIMCKGIHEKETNKCKYNHWAFCEDKCFDLLLCCRWSESFLENVESDGEYTEDEREDVRMLAH